jgi:hypothetical protein
VNVAPEFLRRLSVGGEAVGPKKVRADVHTPKKETGQLRSLVK